MKHGKVRRRWVDRGTTALDTNCNGVIDADDRVTLSVASVTQRDGKTVERTATRTPSGRETWQTRFGLTTHMLTTLQPANASRTETETRPDGTQEVN